MFPHGVDALGHAEGTHVQIVAGGVPGFHHIFDAQFQGIHADFFGDHVQLLFKASPGDDGPVAPLGPAGGFVVVDPVAVVFHVGQLVGAGKQRTGVVDGCNAEAGVGPAVQVAFVLQGQEGPVFFGPGGDLVGEAVAGPAQHEDLFPGVVHLYGFPGFTGQDAAGQFHGVGGRFDAETGAHVRLFHPDLAHVQSHDHGHGALDIVGNLGGGDQGEVAPIVEFGQAGLHFDEGPVLALGIHARGDHDVRLGQGLFHVPEFLVDLGAEVAGEVFVDLGGTLFHGLFHGEDRRKDLVFHFNEFNGLFCGVQVHGGHGRNLVTDVADLVHGKDGFVVPGRADPVFDGAGFLVGDYGFHPGKGLGLGCVNGENSGMGMGALEQGAVQHAGPGDVVGEDGLARGLVRGVHTVGPAGDNIKILHTASLKE